MRSRMLVVLAGTLVAITIGAPIAVAAPTAYPIHLVKDCSTYTGDNPSLCTISASDLGAIPVGTKVWYRGPVLTNLYFLSSNVTLEEADGSVGTGYCMGLGRLVPDRRRRLKRGPNHGEGRSPRLRPSYLPRRYDARAGPTSSSPSSRRA